MLIIIDRKVPSVAKEKLSAHGTLMDLATEGIVYPAVSGHPDIFFCKTPDILVISPNLPVAFLQKIEAHKIQVTKGNHASGIRYPASVHYNAAVSDVYLVHRLEFTDPAILQNCHALKKIAVKQAYTRCNLLLLKEDNYITSDMGIHKNLKLSGLNGIMVSQEGIILPGFPNGFIGGAMGLLDDTVFIIGGLIFHPEGAVIRKFLEGLGYSIVELYDGPLFDGGGILFLRKG